MTPTQIIDSTLLTALGVGSTYIVGYLCVNVVPRLGQYLGVLINSEALAVHNALLQQTIHESVAYFKAHEKDFEAKGIVLADYVFSRVNPVLPNLSKEDIEHAVAGFLESLASTLNA